MIICGVELLGLCFPAISAAFVAMHWMSYAPIFLWCFLFEEELSYSQPDLHESELTTQTVELDAKRFFEQN